VAWQIVGLTVLRLQNVGFALSLSISSLTFWLGVFYKKKNNNNNNRRTLQYGSLSRDILVARRFGPLAIPYLFLDFFVFNPWDLYYQGYKNNNNNNNNTAFV